MQFEKRKLKAKIYGQDYELTFPTVRQQNEYVKAIKESGEDNAMDDLTNLLERLGLPKDVSMDMELDHLLQLMDALVPTKKK